MTSTYVKENGASQSMPNTVLAELMAAVLGKGKPFRFSAPGFSMTPLIRDGDMITVATKRLRYGDVVAFVHSSGSRLTVHRIVHSSHEGYLIKGDNTPEPDGCIPGSNIIGRVDRVERRGRQVRIGTGIERVIIAFLSRRGWLQPILRMVWRFAKPIAGRRIG